MKQDLSDMAVHPPMNPASGDDHVIVRTDMSSARTVTLNRPRKANALTAAMMEVVAAAIARAGEDEILVLRSASPVLFCAGADIAEFVAGGEALARQEHALLSMIRRLATTAAPVVAIAQGKASGAGAILLALADVVIAADDLEISCPEIRFGMFPIIVEAVLQSRLPAALATRLCLTGQVLRAHEAAGFGLVTEVLPAADFELKADARLADYLERAQALRIARASRLRLQPPAELVRRVESVAPLMADNFRRPGVRESIQAYLANLGRRA
jgi:enoyl-CoA hydratase/carnithine racemase